MADVQRRENVLQVVPRREYAVAAEASRPNIFVSGTTNFQLSTVTGHEVGEPHQFSEQKLAVMGMMETNAHASSSESENDESYDRWCFRMGKPIYRPVVAKPQMMPMRKRAPTPDCW